MKRILGLLLAFASIGGVAFAAEANKHSESSVKVAAYQRPQWYRNDKRRGIRQTRRTVTRTRVVQQGRRVYRETYVVRYLPNGRTDTRVISRVRIS